MTTVTGSYQYNAVSGLGDRDSVMLQKSGLVFDARISAERWECLGRRLMSLTQSVSWWIADWLAFGESRFPGRYEEAIKKTSLNYKTLRNYTWVARQFELSRRHDSLSFAHHAEVAALMRPEQDYWLRKAEEQNWSRNKLRIEVRASLRMRKLPHPDNSADTPDVQLSIINPGGEICELEILNLQLTQHQLARCKTAAEIQQRSIEEWATLVILDASAGE